MALRENQSNDSLADFNFTLTPTLSLKWRGG